MQKDVAGYIVHPAIQVRIIGFGQVRILFLYIERFDGFGTTHVHLCMEFPILLERPHEVAWLVFFGQCSDIDGNTAFVFLPGHFVYLRRN